MDKVVFSSLQQAYDTFTKSRKYIQASLEGEKKSFKEMLILKDILSSQKFSPWFEKNMRRILGLSRSFDTNYDAYDEFYAQHVEFKHATLLGDGYSFPQLIRSGLEPEYVIVLFHNDAVTVIRIPPGIIEKSVLAKSGAQAHFSNKKEKRVSVKLGSPEMRFLERFRDRNLERKLKRASFY